MSGHGLECKATRVWLRSTFKEKLKKVYSGVHRGDLFILVTLKHGHFELVYGHKENENEHNDENVDLKWSYDVIPIFLAMERRLFNASSSDYKSPISSTQYPDFHSNL